MRTQPVRVAIDLETTGLHSEQDAIIEIGALKFAGDELLETYETFVAPAVPIPYRVQRLTGITASKLLGAPKMADVLPHLRTFLGDLPLVGHSVAFDAAFLRRYGLAWRNPLVDTFELASALLPTLSSYSLSSVGEALGIRSPVYHRALADAQLARDVFLTLLARLDDLDASTLEALGSFAAPKDWTPSYFIRSAVRTQRIATEASQSTAFASLANTSLGAQLADKLGMDPRVLSLALTPHSPAGLSRPLLAVSAPPSAPTATVAPRETQSPGVAAAEEQARATIGERVRGCLAGSGVLLTEAQADIVNVAAILSPALRWAHDNQQRVVVSVADSESMARLVQRVVPQALALAGLTKADLPLAEIQDHTSYLCLHRWFGVARDSRDGYLPLDVARGLAKLTVWIGTTQTGSRSEVALNGQELAAWERTRSGAEYADTVSNCVYRRDGYCFVARAQRAANEALVVVTTHQALAGHIVGADPLLPEFSRGIIFDAHLLEDELRRAAGTTLDRLELLSRLSMLAEVEGHGARAGLFHVAAERARREGGQTAHDIDARERRWFAQVERARQSAERFFTSLRAVLLNARGESSGASLGTDTPEHRSLRVDTSIRHAEDWQEAQRCWEELDERLAGVIKVAREVVQFRQLPRGNSSTATDGIATDVLALIRMLDTIRQQGAQMMSGAVGQEDDESVSWLRVPYSASGNPSHGGANQQRAAATASAEAPSRQQRGKQHSHGGGHASTGAQADLPDTPALHTMPVQVASLLAPLYARDRALVLAGPALAIAGDFNYTCGSLGLPEQAQTIASPLDRTEQTLLCLPTDVPEPNAPQYQRHLDDALVRLAIALDGRTVAIFPSHAALRASAVGIKRALERHNILVLAQGQDGSARQLWHTFRTEPRVVLLGAGTFWEGAEQPDMPPACIVVTRIPFPALSDPLVAARAEAWPDRQSQFVVPHAALRMRQALGGLAWSHWHRNVVVLFDRRLQTRDYGSIILGTLARCTNVQESMEQIVERAAEWTAQPPGPENL